MRQRGERRVAVDQVLVDLVGQHPQAVLDGPAADRLGVGLAVDRAGRVRRGDEQDDLRTLGTGRLQLLHGDPVTGGLVGDDLHRDAAREADRLGVGGPVRSRDDDLVARVEDRGEGLVDGLLAAVGHQDLRGVDLVAGVAQRLLRDGGLELGEPMRPGCSGGTSGCGRPRPRRRRCSRGSGSRAHRHRSRSPDGRMALRALALASTARVADSEIAPMRAETRRSEGGVAALMPPCSQTVFLVGTGVSVTGHHVDSMRTGKRTASDRSGRELSVRRRAAEHVHSPVVGLHQPHRSCTRGIPEHAVGWWKPQRVVAQLVEHWSPKPAVGGSSPSGPATHSFARMCAHVRTSMHRRAAPPGAARP